MLQLGGGVRGRRGEGVLASVLLACAARLVGPARVEGRPSPRCGCWRKAPGRRSPARIPPGPGLPDVLVDGAEDDAQGV